MTAAGLAEAIAAFRAGDLAAAEAHCRSYLAEHAQDARAHHLLGLALLRAGRSDEALDALRKADALLPGRDDLRAALAAAWSARAWEAEQRNEDEAARAAAEAALALAGSDFQARYVLGRVAEKAGAPARATEHYLGAQTVAGSPVNVALVLGRLAQLAERAGRHREAFDQVTRANDLLRPRARALEGTSVYGPPAAEDLDRFLSEERLARWAREAERSALVSESGAASRPVFLVGFPRSGTTLLDRILAAHPAVEVLEERDTLGPLLATYAGTAQRLSLLDTVAAGQRATARRRYRERVREEGAGGDLVVDKLPLNSLYLGLIHRLLPEARVLFAVRDPRDVCLSCYFQSFGLNEAMAQFLDWRSTARYYDTVLRIACRALDRLPMPVAFVRYEALVDDPRNALTPALDLLGLGWDTAMARFQERLVGERIDTPSYDQVTRPLHRRAVGRWHAYREPIAAVADLLAPWLKRFGYRD